MTRDPLVGLALDRASAISADIEEQLTARREHGMRPLIALLHKARAEAADALARLVDVDAARADAVRELQHKVWRFADLVRWLQELTAEGLDRRYEVADAERDELERLVAPPDDRLDADTKADREHLGI